VGTLIASACGERTPRGFTLVETLIVLLVIGVGAGLIFANFGGDERGLAEREAKRLAGALEHAAATAQWQDETLGVSAEPGAYRFWHRGDASPWVPVSGDDLLAPRALPAGFGLTPLSYAGAPVAPGAILPFRASGRNEPYSILLRSPQWAIVVRGDPLNRVTFAAAPASP
jgi:prepilin-type N-terminal cleavage/methylation domain-containing protein